MKFKVLFGFYIFVFASLFLYSFTQIDLGLVFSHYPFLYGIEKAFQQIGYFQRPLSTCLYFIILFLLTILYVISLQLANKKMFMKDLAWKIIFAAVILLTFSYSAFSYDIFNYIFDAKIVTHYHANPYLHKALDYPGDPMLGFMHWTQRVYPYGPVWLVITVPLSFIGLQIFLVTFFLFKILASASFVGSLYFISRILKKLQPEKEVFGLVFFGLNPLILIESLVSAHIDIVMMFFSLMAFSFFIEKKYVMSYASLFVSVGIKFLTGLLLPVFVLMHIAHSKKKKFSPEKVLFFSLALLLIGVIWETKESGNFQPWYLLAPLSFAVFLSHKYYVLVPSVIISVLSLLLYVPFLYVGNWNPPIPTILLGIIITSYVLSAIASGIIFYSKKK